MCNFLEYKGKVESPADDTWVLAVASVKEEDRLVKILGVNTWCNRFEGSLPPLRFSLLHRRMLVYGQ